MIFATDLRPADVGVVIAVHTADGPVQGPIEQIVVDRFELVVRVDGRDVRLPYSAVIEPSRAWCLSRVSASTPEDVRARAVGELEASLRRAVAAGVVVS